MKIRAFTFIALLIAFSGLAPVIAAASCCSDASCCPLPCCDRSHT